MMIGCIKYKDKKNRSVSMEKKKVDGQTLLAQSRAKKQRMQSKALDKKLGKKKNGAKFDKVNFNG